jgi:hypothetical protein
MIIIFSITANSPLKAVCYMGLKNTESSDLCAPRKPSLPDNSDNVHIHAGKIKGRVACHKVQA